MFFSFSTPPMILSVCFHTSITSCCYTLNSSFHCSTVQPHVGMSLLSHGPEICQHRTTLLIYHPVQHSSASERTFVYKHIHSHPNHNLGYYTVTVVDYFFLLCACMLAAVAWSRVTAIWCGSNYVSCRMTAMEAQRHVSWLHLQFQ